MLKINPILEVNEITAKDILNWLLPVLGVFAAALVILFVWRYVRRSDEVGRISEFNEKTFQKLIKTEDQEHLPNCQNCKMPMRAEIRYKDFMKDSGDFLISKETVEQTTDSLAATGRISDEDKLRILTYFKNHPEIKQQMFKRYKCPNCSNTQVLPYQTKLKLD